MFIAQPPYRWHSTARFYVACVCVGRNCCADFITFKCVEFRVSRPFAFAQAHTRVASYTKSSCVCVSVYNANNRRLYVACMRSFGANDNDKTH